MSYSGVSHYLASSPCILSKIILLQFLVQMIFIIFQTNNLLSVERLLKILLFYGFSHFEKKNNKNKNNILPWVFLWYLNLFLVALRKGTAN